MLDFLLQPFDYAANHLVSSNKRLFWLYLVSSFALAFWLLNKTNSVKETLQTLFDKKVWLHTSAKQDYIIWLINGLIKTTVVLPILFSAAPIAININKGLDSIFGEFNLAWLAPSLVPVLFTIMLFLLDDFTRFLLHFLSHRIPLLWRFHQIHHSAKVLTPITVYRIHPVESALYAVRLVLVQGISIGLGVYLFGVRLEVIDVLGANIFIFLFNIFGANLRHSHVWLSWGNKLENWFISPAQHQIHHSMEKQHYDKNFGSALSIWDKLFGSLLLANDTQRPKQFGLKTDKLNRLSQLYFRPFGYKD